MQVQFLFPRKIGSKLYPKGLHEIADKFAKDWFFKAQLVEKHISIVSADPAVLKEAHAPYVAPAIEKKSSKDKE